MDYSTFSVRMESDTKKEFDFFCREVGMNATTAINMFAKAVIREKRLPFEVELAEEPFFASEVNMKHLSAAIERVEAGNYTVHEMPEAEDTFFTDKVNIQFLDKSISDVRLRRNTSTHDLIEVDDD